MLSLKEALELPDNSNVTVEIKVLECTENCQQTTTKKTFFEAVIADNTGSSTIKVFKQSEHQKFIKKPSLLLQDIIKKSDSFIFTVRSKAPYCAPVAVDVNPKSLCKEVTVGTVEHVLNSQSKTDIVCRVIQSSPMKSRTSSHTGTPLKLKHLMIKDHSGTAKIALWEKAAEQDFEENTIVKIKNVKGTTFNKLPLIGTTSTSTVEFLPDDSEIPYVNEQDKQLLLTDKDFTETIRFSAILKGFDNISIYNVCNNKKCNNKQLTNNTCTTCGQVATTSSTYMRANLTVSDNNNNLQTLTIFFPEYCTLCAYMNKQPELSQELVTANLSALLGKQISYTLRQATMGNIIIKRETDD